MVDLITQTVIRAAKEEQEKGEGKIEEEDPFKKLPDDLIVSHIFDKICDANSLSRCCLVSKRFSSLVYRTHDVCFKIPSQYAPQNRHIDVMVRQRFALHRILIILLTFVFKYIIYALFHSRINRNPWPPHAAYHPSPAFLVNFMTHFLGKFKSMRSLRLEFDSSGSSGQSQPTRPDPLLKWKFHPKSSTIILLFAGSILDIDDDINIDANDLGFFPQSLVSWSVYHSWDARFRTSMLEMLLPSLTESLQNVAVTDSKNAGNFKLRENDLAWLRNRKTGSVFGGQGKQRFRFTPLVKLPLSGRLMKMAALVIIAKDAESEVGTDDEDLIVKEAFDGEEIVYWEAAIEMLKKEVL